MCPPSRGVLYPFDEKMLISEISNMQSVIATFIKEDIFSCKAFGSGHINSTYRVDTPQGVFVLQRINHSVFKNPEQVMANIAAITSHLQNKGCTAMRFIATAQGNYCYRDQEGNYWRMSEFLPGLALDAPETPEDLYEAGFAFGQFQKDLEDFPAHTLFETIPNFHNTPDRYRKFREALKLDVFDRAKDATELTAFLFEQEPLAGTLERMRKEHRLPLRVTHNDTKLNNVLLDEKTRKPLCVLDLDTVMPGLSGYDFGDGIRFGAATGKEDDDRNYLDLELFTQYAKGYLDGATNLTEQEIAVLPLSAFIMTLECGMRFLTDYLEGDHYFRVHFAGQNLIRAKNQLSLAADILEKLPQMEEIIKKALG